MPACRAEYTPLEYEKIKQAAREAGTSIRQFCHDATIKAAHETIKYGTRIENRQLAAAIHKARKADTATTPQEAARALIEKIEGEPRLPTIVPSQSPAPGTTIEVYNLGKRHADTKSQEQGA